jgi:hypothetical protein
MTRTSLRLIARIIFFGLCSGAIWSLVPGFLSEILRPGGQALTVIAAGIVTGMILALLLAFPLLKTGWVYGAWLGLLSLPLGAFTFGVSISVVQYLLFNMTGIAYRFVNPRFAPMSAGADYALGSLLPYFAIVLLPCAVLTTLCLQRTLRKARL